MLQSGALTHPENIFDGAFGLGINGSVLSQLSSNGVVPMMFTLCLDGSEDDSSFLYFGEIEDPDTVYTRLISSKSRYCLNLQRMYVNIKKININSSVFATPTVPGIVFDSGIRLAYLPDEAYRHFIDAIITSSLKPKLVQRYDGFGKRPCFITQSSIDDAFPTVKLHFAGGAVMTLYPRNYLMLQHPVENSTFKWCMAWVDNGYGSATVGDIALKDKVLVHDLANMRISWKEQNCSARVKFKSGQILTSSFWKTNKELVIIVSVAVFTLANLILFICCVLRCRSVMVETYWLPEPG